MNRIHWNFSYWIGFRRILVCNSFAGIKVAHIHRYIQVRIVYSNIVLFIILLPYILDRHIFNPRFVKTFLVNVKIYIYENIKHPKGVLQ